MRHSEAGTCVIVKHEVLSIEVPPTEGLKSETIVAPEVATPGNVAEASMIEVKQRRLQSAKKDLEDAARITAKATVHAASVNGQVSQPAPTNAVWESYAKAYELRYGVGPERNPAVNGQIKTLLTRIRKAEAPDVAAFYVESNAANYVRAGHPVRLLLYDAEKLRTEWFTGRRVTEGAARELDKRQTSGDGWNRLRDKYVREEGMKETVVDVQG